MSDKKETVETTEVDEFQKKKEENEVLFDQLTNKNREYMIKLNRQLEGSELTEEQKVLTFNDMLKNIVKQQENHITARRLYGTVTDQAHYLTANPNGEKAEVIERSEPWKLYIDGSLLLGGMFALITALPYFFQGNQQAGLGLITLLMNFILGGFAVMVITKYAPVPGQKGGFLKYIAATTVTMMVWILLMSLGALVPGAINPHIPAPYTATIGVIAIAVKWYVKRKLDIKGTLI
jgi:uncharacterized membrane-anchored protein